MSKGSETKICESRINAIKRVDIVISSGGDNDCSLHVQIKSRLDEYINIGFNACNIKDDTSNDDANTKVKISYNNTDTNHGTGYDVKCIPDRVILLALVKWD